MATSIAARGEKVVEDFVHSAVKAKVRKTVEDQINSAAASAFSGVWDDKDSSVPNNPYAAAFASDATAVENAPNIFNFSPYHLSSVYGEDTIGLLDDEYSHDTPSPRVSIGSSQDAPDPFSPYPSMPYPPRQSRSRASQDYKTDTQSSAPGSHSFFSLNGCLSLILCVAEWRMFRTLHKNLLQKEASLVRQAFYIHWLHVLSLLINCILLGILVLGPAPTSGNSRESIPAFSAWMWSIGYLVVSSYVGWFLWTRQLYINLKYEAEAAWTRFDIFFLIHVLFTTVLLVGIPGSGFIGLISVLLIRNWVPRFTFALVTASICIAFQGIVLLWSLCLWQSTRLRRYNERL
mmetsp:Transcript_19943/g.39156  ORF Transcript_19943/g.39156 Transcript_19943/m.39156 type:complete len:347 (-) Transcript_19943:104-1144(-)